MYRAGWRAAEAEAEAALAFDPAVELAVEQVCDPLFRFRNNAQLAAHGFGGADRAACLSVAGGGSVG